jgi:S1-C subfamily serine protease
MQELEMRTGILGLAAIVVGGVAFWWGLSAATDPSSVASAQPNSGPRFDGSAPMGAAPAPIPFESGWYDASGLTPDEAVNVAVYDNVNRSVVNINTLGLRAEGFFLMATPERGNGSGSVLDQEGHILTNYHVIEGARQVAVTLFDGETYAATLVGSDAVNDIAVLKIDAPAESLYPISLGDSDSLRVGMRVFALGNPFGLDRTMSEGIISSLNRSLEVQENWIIQSIIQIDASINPGNSGGPLLDAHGQMIGMNTAIASRVNQSAGIGFAIPINLVRRVVPELIEHGRVIRGNIGISSVTIVDEGLRIAILDEGGPAERAGLRGPEVVRRRTGPLVFESVDRAAADIIVAVDGTPVATVADLQAILGEKRPGDVLNVTVLRQGELAEVAVELGE